MSSNFPASATPAPAILQVLAAQVKQRGFPYNVPYDPSCYSSEAGEIFSSPHATPATEGPGAFEAWRLRKREDSKLIVRTQTAALANQVVDLVARHIAGSRAFSAWTSQKRLGLAAQKRRTLERPDKAERRKAAAAAFAQWKARKSASRTISASSVSPVKDFSLSSEAVERWKKRKREKQKIKQKQDKDKEEKKQLETLEKQRKIEENQKKLESKIPLAARPPSPARPAPLEIPKLRPAIDQERLRLAKLTSARFHSEWRAQDRLQREKVSARLAAARASRWQRKIFVLAYPVLKQRKTNEIKTN